MKIAQVSPLYESVPPRFYGGTERVVSYLTDELVRQGHDVTLFASGDSITLAKLIEIVPKALRLERCTDANVYNILELKQVMEMAPSFDIIHFHTDYIHFPVSTLGGWLNVTTLHGRLDIEGLDKLYQHFNTLPLVSISLSQRKPLAHAHWVGNVAHGLPVDLYDEGKGKGGYAAFMGRISPEKRVDRAIEIAGKAGIQLKIAAKVDAVDEVYFEREIKPLLSQPHVEFIGEIGDDQKGTFLGNALVTLFPIDWPEPFGMVMIESLACGTPVVAYNMASVPEVLDNGTSGFIVNSIEEAVHAVANIGKLKRSECRRAFLERFSVKRMANDYLTLYQALIEGSRQLPIPERKDLEAAGPEVLSA